jgi:hypothetical protein
MFHTAGRVSNHLHCTKKVWYFPGKIGKFRCLQFPAFHPAAKLSTAIAGYFPAAQLNNDELGITEDHLFRQEAPAIAGGGFIEP